MVSEVNRKAGQGQMAATFRTLNSRDEADQEHEGWGGEGLDSNTEF